MQLFNTIPAAEIKRRGMAAVDAVLKKGAVHIIKNNQPAYVVLSEEQFQKMVANEEKGLIERINLSLHQVKQGHVKKYKNAAQLIEKFGLEG